MVEELNVSKNRSVLTENKKAHNSSLQESSSYHNLQEGPNPNDSTKKTEAMSNKKNQRRKSGKKNQSKNKATESSKPAATTTKKTPVMKPNTSKPTRKESKDGYIKLDTDPSEANVAEEEVQQKKKKKSKKKKADDINKEDDNDNDLQEEDAVVDKEDKKENGNDTTSTDEEESDEDSEEDVDNEKAGKSKDKAPLTTSLLAKSLKMTGVWTYDLIDTIKERFTGTWFKNTFNEDYAKKLVNNEIVEHKTDLFDQFNYLLMTHSALSDFTPETQASIADGKMPDKAMTQMLLATQNANLALFIVRDIFNNLKKGKDPFHATRRVTTYSARHYRRGKNFSQNDDEDESGGSSDNESENGKGGKSGKKRGADDTGTTKKKSKKPRKEAIKKLGKPKDSDYMIDISLDDFLTKNTVFNAKCIKKDFGDLPTDVWTMDGRTRREWITDSGEFLMRTQTILVSSLNFVKASTNVASFEKFLKHYQIADK